MLKLSDIYWQNMLMLSRPLMQHSSVTSGSVINFFTVTMASIGKWLRENKDQCDRAYQTATLFLIDDPSKINKLEKIYQNPSYYCGYIIRALRGNLKCSGSVPSE